MKLVVGKVFLEKVKILSLKFEFEENQLIVTTSCSRLIKGPHVQNVYISLKET